MPDLAPSPTVDCWSCETPNIPGRLFCVSCGSFIAVGAGAAWAGAVDQATADQTPAGEATAGGAAATALAAAGHRRWRASASHPELRASSEVQPGEPLPEASAPFVAGAMSLGSYADANRHRATRARTLTAVTSVALTLVVGLAALYVALPGSDGNGETRTAAGAPAASEPAARSAAAASPAPAAAATEREATSEPEVVPVSGVGIVAAPPAEPATATEPTEPNAAIEPDAIEPAAIEPIKPDAAPPDATEPDQRTVDQQDEPGEPDAGTATPTAHGWVCEGPVQVQDSRARDWSLGRVTFRARPGFERVVLHLERSGSGSGAVPSVIAEGVPTARLNSLMPGVRRPALGRSTIGLRLAGGIGGNLALRGYRPSGLVEIKEFSVYPAGMGSRNVLISTASDSCIRLRVPAWNDPSNSVRRAEILIDVRS